MAPLVHPAWAAAGSVARDLLAAAASQDAAAGAPSPHYNTYTRRDLSTNHTQRVTLGVIAAYTVIIALLWNIPYVSYILWPLKMLTIAFHEFGHAFAAVCTGGKVVGITLDPREGGETRMLGGKSSITLPAGYLGSSLIGALLIFCGFHVNASKVASIVLGVCFLLTLWWGKRDWLTILTVLFAVAVLVGSWFISHSHGLRFVVVSPERLVRCCHVGESN